MAKDRRRPWFVNAKTTVRRRNAKPSPKVARILASGLFDMQWYATSLGRNFESEAHACNHYLRRGRKLGFTPHPLFIPEWLFPSDWSTRTQDPLLAYLTDSATRARSPHPLIDPAKYLRKNPGAAKHAGGVLGHLLASEPDPQLPYQPFDGGRPQTVGEYIAASGSQAARWRTDEQRRTAPRRTNAFEDSWLPPAAWQPPASWPRVSVIMPVWNRVDRLAEAIRSVQRQSYADWELLVVDDGSHDGSLELAQEITASDNRIRVLSQPHAGVSAARNTALNSATGEYLAFLDADNTWRPNMLKQAMTSVVSRGLVAAHCAVEMQAPDVTNYRAFDGGLKHLEIQNHVDLNALIVAADLVSRVGGFDESLKRAVDYDFAWRIEQDSHIEFLPFVGVNYHADPTDSRRITVSQPSVWGEVVKNRRLIDWDQLAANPRVPGKTTVVIVTWDDAERTRRAVLSVLRLSKNRDLDVVVVDNGSRLSVHLLLGAICALDARLKLIRSPVNTNFAFGANLGFTETSGEFVVFIDNDVEVTDNWLQPLIESLQDSDVLAVQSLLLNPDRTIESAGLAFPGRSAVPVRVLHGHPMEDASRLTNIPCQALSASTMALRARDFLACHGFDPTFANGCEDADLSQRLLRHRSGRLSMEPTSLVIHHTGGTPRQHDTTQWNRRTLTQRWPELSMQDGAYLWRAAGFQVPGYTTDNPDEPFTTQRLSPLLVRRPEKVRGGLFDGQPRMRWALKTPAPASRAEQWGDYHFAQSLASALRRHGQDVVVDMREARYRSSGDLDDVCLDIRGLFPFYARAGKVNLAWIISHPDSVDPKTLEGYDRIFAASDNWSIPGFAVEPLLQCTDSRRFSFEHGETNAGPPIVFVGNSRNIRRPVIDDVISLGHRVLVYGANWEKFIDPRDIWRTYVANDKVAEIYRSSGVVLNDHWEDMRYHGFLSNRLFDAVAAGARVISDTVPGLEELFLGSVRTYRDLDELQELLTLPRDVVFPDDHERRIISEHVRRTHSFDARAARLIEVAYEVGQ